MTLRQIQDSELAIRNGMSPGKIREALSLNLFAMSPYGI